MVIKINMNKLASLINRENSVVTGKIGLEILYIFKNFPVFFGCVDSDLENDLFVDMIWAIDRESGVIQLTKLIPLDILYQEQHVDGCGPTWQQYYQDFANYLLQNKIDSWFEIGGGMGELAKIVTKLTPAHWTVIEPNPIIEQSDQIDVIKGFFDKNFKTNKKIEALVFSQVMEHAYNPNEFLATANKILEPGGKLIFAYPNLELWLKNKYTNALNFEHTMFLTDCFVDYLLIKNNFIITDKYFYKDHSIFYTAEKGVNALTTVELPNKYEEYRTIFTDFISYHQAMITDLNEKIDKAGRPVYLFGAHIFSEYLLAFGLDKSKITSILDNSPTKQGRRLYGTEFIVDSPRVLKGLGEVNVILKAGIYNEEIKKDILENINPDVIFW